MNSDATTPRKKTAMNARPRNPYVPVQPRAERWDETWQRRRDPIAYQAVKEMTRRGY